MSARPFGSTGVDVAPLALGAMNFGIGTPPDEAAAMLMRALDAGITIVDTADVYGESEKVVGDVLARTGRRADVVLATKVGLPRGDAPPDTWHRREHIVASCDQSLRNLRTDRIDLYQLHRPSPVVAIEETLGVLGELVDAGKIRWIGTSTFAAWMIADALALSREQGFPPIVSEQPPYNMLDRRADNELLPMCEHHHVATIPWSPLAGGILAGRYDSLESVPDDSRAARLPMTRDRLNQRALEVAIAVGELARERGLSTSQLALLWSKDQPGVTAPIIGPRTLAQLDDALAVLDLTLDDDARVACDALVHPGNAVTDFHSTAFWMRAEVATG